MSLLSYDYDSRVLAYSRSAHGAPDEDNHLLFWDNYLIGRELALNEGNYCKYTRVPFSTSFSSTCNHVAVGLTYQPLQPTPLPSFMILHAL